VFEKNSSGFRQRNSVFRAIKKRHSEFLFQRFDLKCDCRLCEIESFGSLSEIQIIGNCAEDLQSEIFHFGSSCKPLSLSARCKMVPNITSDWTCAIQRAVYPQGKTGPASWQGLFQHHVC